MNVLKILGIADAVKDWIETKESETESFDERSSLQKIDQIFISTDQPFREGIFQS